MLYSVFPPFLLPGPKLSLTGRTMSRKVSLDTGVVPPSPAALSSLLANLQPLSEPIVFEVWESNPSDQLLAPRKGRAAAHVPHEGPAAKRTVVFNNRDVLLTQVGAFWGRFGPFTQTVYDVSGRY